MAQVFSFEFSENSKRTLFTENLWTTASGFSFSEATTGGVLWKKVFLKISQNLQENTCGLRNFQEHHFYWTPLDDYFWLFPASLLQWNTANSVWKISAATRVEVLCKNMEKDNNTDESGFSENEIPDLNSLEPSEFEPETNIGDINSSSSDNEEEGAEYKVTG